MVGLGKPREVPVTLALQMLELALARSLDGAHRVVQGSRPGSASAASFGRPAKQAHHPLSLLHLNNTPSHSPAPRYQDPEKQLGRRPYRCHVQIGRDVC